jgi:hypothetical protein
MRGFREFSLFGQGVGRNRNLYDRRRTPFSGERGRLRRVKAHGQVEWSFRRRQPVGFLVLARAFVLEIEVERAVRVELERHPTADGETIKHIGHLKPFIVIESDRPESINRRKILLLKVNCYRLSAP